MLAGPRAPATIGVRAVARRMTFRTLIAEPWADYGLVDSGHGRKLERYGPYRFIRPEPQAMWAPACRRLGRRRRVRPRLRRGRRRALAVRPAGAARRLAARLGRGRASPRSARRSATSVSSPTWRRYGPGCASGSDEGAEALNLFGYTGVGTLALAAKGARVTHVDASKKSVEAGEANAALSGMADRPIRWLVDDAAKFAAREVRRGRRYDGIILDPPKFGRGPEGEVWRLEEGLPGLIADCRRLLDADSRFLFLTVYAVRMSALAIGGLLEAGARRSRRHDRARRPGGARGGARPAAPDRDLRALV